MPGYLADTCVIIDLINDRGSRREFIRNLLQPSDTLGYCTINLIEVYTGMRHGEEPRATDVVVQRGGNCSAPASRASTGDRPGGLSHIAL